MSEINNHGSLYQKNMNLLNTRYREICDKVLNIKSSDRYSTRVVKGKDQTLSVNGIQLSSRHDRLAQSLKLASSVSEESSEVHVYGFALGDVIPILASRKNVNRICVHILNLEIFKLVLSYIDLDEIISSKVELLYGENTDGKIYPDRVVIVPAIILADDLNLKLAASLDSTLDFNFTRDEVLKTRDEINERIQSNIDFIKNDRDVSDLFGIAKNQKIAVVASGPSLESGMELLADLKRNNVLVVAVDTSGRSLSNGKISADYVVSIDKNIKCEHVNCSAFSEASLVYFPMLSKDVIQHFSHRYIAYGTGVAYTEIRSSYQHSVLFSSGSVLLPAVDLAVKMGAGEIFLFGADFAYSGGKTHAGYDTGEGELILPGVQTVEILGQNCNKLQTHRAFRQYLFDLEQYIEKCNGCKKFINMSATGALIRGTIPGRAYSFSGIL